VSVTQGLATLDVIDRDGIQQNALTVGSHLKQRSPNSWSGSR